MARSRRYEEYPQMARLVRAMSDEGRELVAHWHRVLTTALEGAVPQLARAAETGLLEAGLTVDEACAAHGGAEGALAGWLSVMRQVAALLADASPGDWCCKRGMLVSPAPCPQHDFDVRVLYDEGTIIEREYGEGTEKAVCVNVDTGLTQHWRSVRFPLEYTTAEVGQGRWTVVGRV